MLHLTLMGNLRRVDPSEVIPFKISANKLLNAIVNFGAQTHVSKRDAERFKHLIPKQFYYANGGKTLVFGVNSVDASNPSDISEQKKAEIIKYIKDNFHWTVSKKMLWDPEGSDMTVSSIFPEISAYFENKKNSKK